MKKLFSNTWLVVFGAILLILIASGIVALATDSYSSGKLAVQPTLNDTTSEFKERVQQLQIDLIEKREENTQLQAQVSSLEAEKQLLIESGEASEEQIAILDAEITSKNSTIAQNEATISTLSNRVTKFISIIDKTVTEVTAEDLEGLTEIGDYAFYRCFNLVSVEFPNTITRIGAYAFSQTGLTSVEFPSSVVKIDSSAFNLATLSEVNFSDGLQHIGQEAFYSSSIATLSLPDSIKTIGKNAFNSCKQLTGTISMPTNLESVGDSVFSGCSLLTEVDFSKCIKLSRLGYAMFTNCKALTAVTLSENINISDWAFNGCSLLSTVNIPSGLTSVGYSSFAGCTSLVEISLPDTITRLDYSAFLNCSSLTTVNIPTGITKLDSTTFQNCTSLVEIVIPSNVTTISTKVFAGCTNLESITIESSSVPTLSVADAIPSGATLYVHNVEAYRSASVWSTLPNEFIEIV